MSKATPFPPAERPPRDTINRDNRQAVKALVQGFEKLLRSANTTLAHLALIAGREGLSNDHKVRLATLLGQLGDAKNAFDIGVTELSSSAKVDSRLADTARAIDQLTVICRSLM